MSIMLGIVWLGCAGVIAASSASTAELSLETFTGIGSTTRAALQSGVQGAEDDRALLWAYQRKQDPPALLLHQDNPGITAAHTGLSVRLKSLEVPTTVAVVLQEGNGAQYDVSLSLPVDAWEHRLLRWEDFTLQADSRDANGRLDPTQVKHVLFIDVAAFMGQGGTNTVLIDHVQRLTTMAEAPPPAIETVVKCSTGSQDTDESALVHAWNALKARGMQHLQTASGWGPPELVPGGVNTIGWEDSAFISPDGQTLYVAYANLDLLSFVMGADPGKIAAYQRGPSRGNPNMFVGMLARRTGEAFCAPAKFPYSRAFADDYGAMQAADGRWYFARHTDSGGVDLFEDDALLPPPVQTSGTEDNPHVIHTSYGRELFFNGGDRPGASGVDLWMAKHEPGGWAVPVAVAAPINLPSSEEIQPHLTADGTLYFSSDRETGMTSIWRSQRQDYNAWGSPQKVLWPGSGGEIVGVGEPTLTADGQWLYFVAVFRDGANRYDADVGRVRRLTNGTQREQR